MNYCPSCMVHNLCENNNLDQPLESQYKVLDVRKICEIKYLFIQKHFQQKKWTLAWPVQVT